MQVKNFEDLEIWKDARALTRGIYHLTRDSKFFERFRFAGSNQAGSSLNHVQHCRRILNGAATKSLFSFSM